MNHANDWYQKHMTSTLLIIIKVFTPTDAQVF
jgi:hypothetical protein